MDALTKYNVGKLIKIWNYNNIKYCWKKISASSRYLVEIGQVCVLMGYHPLEELTTGFVCCYQIFRVSGINLLKKLHLVCFESHHYICFFFVVNGRVAKG